MPGRSIVKLFLGLIAAALVISLVINGPAALLNLLSSKQEARNAKGQTKAATRSGAEAASTISNLAAGDAAIEKTTEEGTDAIDKATPGDSNDVADRAACGMRSYRDNEQCAGVRGADPAAVAGADASGRTARERQARGRSR